MGDATHLKKYHFKKGVSPNPGGRLKIPKELQKIRPYISDELSRIISKYMRMPKIDFQKMMKTESDNMTMLDATICSILAKAYSTGDSTKLDFLLTRVVGKVKEVEVAPIQVSNQPQIIVSLPDNGTTSDDVLEMEPR